jgi:hypothetical protein
VDVPPKRLHVLSGILQRFRFHFGSWFVFQFVVTRATECNQITELVRLDAGLK